MTKDELLEKLHKVSQSWKGKPFLYDAESQEERLLIQEFLNEGILIWDGGFYWGNGPEHSIYKIRE